MSLEGRGSHPAEAEVSREKAPDFGSVAQTIESNIERALEEAEPDSPWKKSLETLAKLVREKVQLIADKGNETVASEDYNRLFSERMANTPVFDDKQNVIGYTPENRVAAWLVLAAADIDRAERLKDQGEIADDKNFKGVTHAAQVVGGNVTVDTNVNDYGGMYNQAMDLTYKALGIDPSEDELAHNDPRIDAIWRNVGTAPKSRIWGTHQEKGIPSFEDTENHAKDEQAKALRREVLFYQTNIPNFILRDDERGWTWGHYHFPDRLKQWEDKKESKE